MTEEITVKRACELLSLAAGGTFTFDTRFKAACKKAVEIMRQAEHLAAVVAPSVAVAPPVAEPPK